MVRATSATAWLGAEGAVVILSCWKPDDVIVFAANTRSGTSCIAFCNTNQQGDLRPADTTTQESQQWITEWIAFILGQQITGPLLLRQGGTSFSQVFNCFHTHTQRNWTQTNLWMMDGCKRKHDPAHQSHNHVHFVGSAAPQSQTRNAFVLDLAKLIEEKPHREDQPNLIFRHVNQSEFIHGWGFWGLWKDCAKLTLFFLLSRQMSFGMVKAKNTYSAHLSILGGLGRTQLESVSEDVIRELFISKIVAAESQIAESTQEEETFEVILRPPNKKGPFEGSFFLSFPIKSSCTPGQQCKAEAKKRRKEEEAEEMKGMDVATATTTNALIPEELTARALPEEKQEERERVEVVVTAKVLRKGMGTPSLKGTSTPDLQVLHTHTPHHVLLASSFFSCADGVRCVAVDNEDDSDNDSDWQGFWQGNAMCCNTVHIVSFCFVLFCFGLFCFFEAALVFTKLANSSNISVNLFIV